MKKAVWLVITLLFAGAAVPVASPTRAAVIPCALAADAADVTVDTDLDPSCTYAGGFDIRASGVTLDCHGATLLDTEDRRFGIRVIAPSDVALHDITIRDCVVDGFLNSIRVTRDGFKQLDPDHFYDNAIHDVLIDHVTVRGSHGVGIFVDGYVTTTTIRNSDIGPAGSAGIYLEAGSRGNVVEGNDIHDNGAIENGPAGQVFTLGPVTVRFWGTGREGLAIDGSRDNQIRDNHFWGNRAGAIFLYKNCGEFVNERPDSWWHRYYGADGNVIEDNTFDGGLNGVWVGSRMAENTLPMDCSDPVYVSSVGKRIRLDHAADNTVRGNTFNDVTYGVRVEDDGAVVEDNTFTGTDPAHAAIIVGTLYRTTVLDHPVTRTSIRGNRSTITGNASPYRWIHGVVDATYTDNQALTFEQPWCEGQQPHINPFIFAIKTATEPPGGPPAPTPDLTPEVLPELPPCPGAVLAATTTTTGPAATSTSTTSVTVAPAEGTTDLPATAPAGPPVAVVAVPTFTG